MLADSAPIRFSLRLCGEYSWLLHPRRGHVERDPVTLMRENGDVLTTSSTWERLAVGNTRSQAIFREDLKQWKRLPAIRDMPWQQSPTIVPGLTQQAAGGTAMADVQAPAGYEYLPQPLLATLRRSYDEKTADNQNLANSMGFAPGAKTAKDMSFKETLDGLNIPDQNGHTLLGVISAIYKRCTKETALWPKIHAIRNVWTYHAGKNVSQGMMWTAKDADGTMSLAHASPYFCTDSLVMSADHQKDTSGRWCLRTCYREIVPAGSEGLHVCVVMPSYRAQDPWGGEHDIHIDRHQLGCTKYRANPHITLQAPDCGCVYSPTGLAGHAKDVIPYFLRKFGVIN